MNSRVVVSGRVQGVWFRESTRRQAAATGVAGWVRNREDGDVEAVFEGTPEAVAAMVVWAHAGPPGALVTGVVETAGEPQGLVGFEIRPTA